MAAHIEGPLYYERMGRVGPVMAFVHPNPMDQSCWIFQAAHVTTWYCCIAIDIPGYGRSPKATPGLTMDDMAQACWAPAGPVLKIDIRQRLLVAVAYDKARGAFLDRPGRREAARGRHGAMIADRCDAAT